MATIATNVQWGSSPKIYFDFAYEKKRDGSTQYYNISVSCDPLTGSSWFGYPIYLEISLDGAVKATYTLKDTSPSQWSSAITYSTGWLAVDNKTSGTTALKIRVYSGYGNTRNTTYGYNLDVDPAASTISCTKAKIGSNPTITINRASPNFTHTVLYRATYEDGAPWIPIVEKTSATTITDWAIPEEFYSLIPNDRKTNIWYRCITYSGNTEIGDYKLQYVFGAVADDEKCIPDVSGTVRDIDERTRALTGDENILIRGWSLAECVMTATPKNSATITKRLVNGYQVNDGTLLYAGTDTGSFEFYVEDSRGYNNRYPVTKALVPYVTLTAHVKAQRTDPTSGKATLEIEGNYYAGSFGKEENALTVLYRQWDGEWEGDDTGYTMVEPAIDEKNNKYSCTVSLEGLLYTKSFPFEVVVKDKLGVVPRKVTIGKGIPVFDWGEDDFAFNVPVTVNGVNLLDKLAELEALIKAKG